MSESENNDKKLSDLFVQYKRIKAEYNDSVLFFRLGDFYELFYEDAEKISKVLDLTLTSKSSGDGKAPMCGIPYHAVETYINKLISLNYKIAICEQLQPAGKGVKLVNRDVVRVITPGTVIDEGTIEDNRNNYIASIFQKDDVVGVAYCEITTGEFKVAQMDGDYIGKLNDFLVRINPSEIICYSDIQLNEVVPCVKNGVICNFSDYDPYKFTKTFSGEILEKYFGIEYENIYELKSIKYAQFSAGALLGYLEETQKRVLSHINKIVVEADNDFMRLDVNTRRNLEIIETLKDRRKKGALLSVIDKTKTSMGARLIKKWIQEPLYNEKEINLRLDAVEELIKKIIQRDSLREVLNSISDIERICGRIAYGNFSPKDAVSLRRSLAIIPSLKDLLSKFETKKLNQFFNNLPDLSKITKLLFDAFEDDSPAIISNGNFIKKGFNNQLDELRSIKANNQSYITELEKKEREETNIPSLKIAYNRVIGYFIEIDTNLAGMVPLRYSRKQTVANKDRYITEELRLYQNSIETADEDALKLERAIFNQIREQLLNNCIDFQVASKIIAELDCLLSFADVAVKNNYCKPKVSAKLPHILIENGRHAVIEDINKKDQFIPNDTLLDADKNKIMIITGPNMAGKSTYMRQVAIITLLAHIGCFVPASKAEISLTDRIFTRVGASDDLTLGQSTFMVEMMEVASILKNATKNSLVVLDEIGRGTSTFDGLSIAWAVVEELANNMNCKTMFSTHYHEITELEGLLPGVKNYKIAIKELNGQLVYLRKIQRGGANRSYGIEVAKLAGVTSSVISRAKQISNELESNDLTHHVISNSSIEQKSVENNKNYLEIASILKDIDVNTITPLIAFDTLCDLVEKVKKG